MFWDSQGSNEVRERSSWLDRKKSQLRLAAVVLRLCFVSRNPSFWTVVIQSAQGSAETRAGVLATTRWSIILSASDSDSDEQKAREALTELCRTYWRPIFLFVSRHGYSIQEAQDLTQDFFVMILESNWLKHADQHRGRFRSFLLKSLQNFLSHAREKSGAIKRGGKVEFVSWDEWMAEAPSQLSMPAERLESLPPERLFDMRWAATVVEHALQRLREECEGRPASLI